ncbi:MULTISPECIES: hypothetical protein [unclassified Streptomyces]|uniref:hypothetical protein n=1 Tax=unclassified Streptomyces TaxID=2593676 RepID=UPI00136E9903|nr:MULTISPECIES: hypothetical protein [unclassified Streptomyces]NEA02221.1 hypothetical protein [Streptomyces sp. SID10116]MYY80817.1 hypothetical protein [Streptomyces sp. SID335]MYZ13231.1 hypothetical protein [Streptomyces sp. SID337]NDZ88290.1 hypothetical protein [Streptomyces sp. SID10115]NEB49943.1 hypothetical protein [Streptomyces sp. SID339]
MERELDAEGQLRLIEGAPQLNEAAGVRERVLGVLSSAAVLTVMAAASMNGISVALGASAIAAVAAVMIGWYWFHLSATRRRPHTAVENAVLVFSTMMVGAPGSKILWNNPAPSTDSWIAASLPAASFLAYLVLRWRR